jgi:hypothetical protein
LFTIVFYFKTYQEQTPMATTKQADQSSIVERMSRLRVRIRLEKASEIPVADKEAFLAFCQQQEEVEHREKWEVLVVSATKESCGEDWTKVPAVPPSR